MIRIVANNVHLEGKRISICGDLAADTTMTELFIQMGIDELSVAPSKVLPLRIKESEKSSKEAYGVQMILLC